MRSRRPPAADPFVDFALELLGNCGRRSLCCYWQASVGCALRSVSSNIAGKTPQPSTHTWANADSCGNTADVVFAARWRITPSAEKATIAGSDQQFQYRTRHDPPGRISKRRVWSSGELRLQLWSAASVL